MFVMMIRWQMTYNDPCCRRIQQRDFHLVEFESHYCFQPFVEKNSSCRTLFWNYEWWCFLDRLMYVLSVMRQCTVLDTIAHIHQTSCVQFINNQYKQHAFNSLKWGWRSITKGEIKFSKNLQYWQRNVPK